MVCFSFVNIDVQPISNPYECVFNIVVANRCYVAYFMCVVVRYTATLNYIRVHLVVAISLITSGINALE